MDPTLVTFLALRREFVGWEKKKKRRPADNKKNFLSLSLLKGKNKGEDLAWMGLPLGGKDKKIAWTL